MRFVGYAALGAIAGSCARYAVGQFLPTESGWPLATFAVNILGAFIIGILSATSAVMVSEKLRAFVVTGVLGGFTTYSAFAVESLEIQSAQIAVLYIVGTFLAGIIAVAFGHWVKERS